MKYIITGAQGTGKSSLIKELSLDYKVIDSISRRLSKTQKINQDADTTSQALMFDTFKSELLNDNYDIYDRGLVDVMAYTMYQFRLGKVSKEEFLRQWNEFYLYSKDCVYFYLPIEFDVVDDGTRSIDENYRKEIDTNIKFLLDFFNIKYYTITGCVGDRVRKIEEIINEKKIL